VILFSATDFIRIEINTGGQGCGRRRRKCGRERFCLDFATLYRFEDVELGNNTDPLWERACSGRRSDDCGVTGKIDID
jgi:hypothetical protein